MRPYPPGGNVVAGDEESGEDGEEGEGHGAEGAGQHEVGCQEAQRLHQGKGNEEVEEQHGEEDPKLARVVLQAGNEVERNAVRAPTRSTVMSAR